MSAEDRSPNQSPGRNFEDVRLELRSQASHLHRDGSQEAVATKGKGKRRYNLHPRQRSCIAVEDDNAIDAGSCAEISHHVRKVPWRRIGRAPASEGSEPGHPFLQLSVS